MQLVLETNEEPSKSNFELRQKQRVSQIVSWIMFDRRVHVED